MTEFSDAKLNPSVISLGLTNGAGQVSGPKDQGVEVHFQRKELEAILWIYGMMVAKGEWRDYAIDTLKEKAIFSIYRRTSEMPLYRIEKVPGLARKQGQYAVLTTSGQILKRGSDLKQVLKVLEKKPKLSVI